MTAALSLSDLADKDDWTVDDLTGLPSDLRYELIDGRLVVTSPTGIHQILGRELMRALEMNCPDGYEVVYELSVSVDRANEYRPDVLVVSADHLDRSPVPVQDLLLAVEIISPTSHTRDMYTKLKSYAAAGITDYWIVDPLFPEGIVLTAYRLGEDGNYQVADSTRQVFSAERPYPAVVDLPALTARRRSLIDRGRPAS